MFTTNRLDRAANIAGAVRFSDLAPESIQWLWPDRIPLGRITLLVSDPGLGKSLLALDIAARVSTGAPWPDASAAAAANHCEPPTSETTSAESAPLPDVSYSSPPPSLPNSSPKSLPPSAPHRPPSSVLLLTAEDDFADTVRPRLAALGADCERIVGISTVPGEDPHGTPRAFALTRDINRLHDLLDAMPDCRLIVIDPISAYLGGTNEYSNTEVQSLLRGLTTIARERKIAILAVSHLRKKDGAAVYRPMGSVAFVAASRASWAICKDVTDASKRLFLPVKNNLAPRSTGLAYSIDTDPQSGAPTICWEPEPVHESFDFAVAAARAAGRPDPERQHAMRWLKQRLAESPLRANQAREEGEVQGISYGTLRRAYRELGGVTVRRSRHPLGSWVWTLPGVTAQNPQGELCAAGDDYDELDEYCEYWIRRASKLSASKAAQNPPDPPAMPSNDQRLTTSDAL